MVTLVPNSNTQIYVLFTNWNYHSVSLTVSSVDSAVASQSSFESLWISISGCQLPPSVAVGIGYRPSSRHPLHVYWRSVKNFNQSEFNTDLEIAPRGAFLNCLMIQLIKLKSIIYSCQMFPSIKSRLRSTILNGLHGTYTRRWFIAIASNRNSCRPV